MQKLRMEKGKEIVQTRCVSSLRLLFFAFSLLLSFFSSAQDGIQPFEDYKLCLTGFFDKKGDTLFPAKFENVSSFNVSYSNRESSYGLFYILSDKQKFGCIDAYGNWFLECKYDNIFYNYHAKELIVKQNGKWGTLNMKRETVFPFEYDSITPGGGWYSIDSTLLVAKNGKWGVYKTNHQPVIPLNYSNMDVIHYILPDTILYKKYFEGHIRNQIDLYDEEGKLQAHIPFPSISSFYEYQDTRSTILFVADNGRKRYTVVDEFGKQRIPLSRNKYVPITSIRDYIEKRKPAYAAEHMPGQKHMRIWNLRNSNASPIYDTMKFIGDWIYARKSDKWCILDTNFNKVTEEQIEGDELYYFIGSNQLVTVESFADFNTVNRNYASYILSPTEKTAFPNVYVVRRTILKNKKSESESDERTFHGIVDLNTGKTSPIVYDSVVRLKGNSKAFYWCVLDKKDSVNGKLEYTVDIYDASVNRVNSICMSSADMETIFNISADYYTVKPDPYLIEFRPAKGEIKPISLRWLDGSQPKVHDFESYIDHKWLNKDSTGFVTYKDEWNSAHLVNIEGLHNPFEGQLFDKIAPLEYGILGGMIELRKGPNSTFVNRQFETLIDSSRMSLHGSSYHLSNGDDCRLFVNRQGYLYGLLENKFELIDSTFFNNRSDEMHWIEKYICVNNSGKIYGKEFLDSVQQTTPVKIGGLEVFLYKNVLNCKVRSTGEVIKIPNVSRFERAILGIQVTSTDGKIGVLSSETLEWIFPMKYNAMKPCAMDHIGRNFFLSERIGDKEQWILVDPKGKKLTETVFNMPFQYRESPWKQLAKSNGKYGVLNEKYEWVIQPIYNYAKESLVFTEDKNYGFISWKTNKVFFVPHDSLEISGIQKYYIFYHRDSVSIVDVDGKVLLSKRPIATMTSTSNLYAATKAFSNEGFRPDTLVYSMKPGNPVLKRMNEIFWVGKTKIVTAADVKTTHSLKQKEQRGYNRQGGIRAMYYTHSFLVEKVYGYLTNDNPDACSDGINQPFFYKMWRTRGDSLVEIKTFDDLFQSGVDYEERVDAVIEKEIQRQQTLGLACADVKAFTRELKKHFVIAAGKLIFYDCDYPKEFIVPVDEIKDLFCPGIFE